MHASLKEFDVTEPPSEADRGVKAATYAFGLVALAKFISRLPAEVAEEELPRMKTTLITVRTFVVDLLETRLIRCHRH